MDNRGGVTVRRILSGRCNCHLISGKEGYLLIDCGGRRKHRQERRRLLRLGVGPKAPLTLVLTHTHFDHVQNAAEIKREFAARIMVHALEAEGLEQGENPPIQGTLPFTRMMTRILNSSPWLLKRFRFTGGGRGPGGRRRHRPAAPGLCRDSYSHSGAFPGINECDGGQ